MTPASMVKRPPSMGPSSILQTNVSYCRATISTKPLSAKSSTVIRCRGRNYANLGMSTVRIERTDADIRIVPLGLPLNCARASSSASILPKCSTTVASRRPPASVMIIVRELRASRRTSRLFSKVRTARLTAVCNCPRRAAARVKLRSRATAMNAASAPKNFLSILFRLFRRTGLWAPSRTPDDG